MGALSSTPSDYEMACGISHPLHVLRREWPRVVLKSIEDQAAFADAVCRGAANDDAFLEDQLRPHDQDQVLPINTTGVGNMAYLALHASERFRAEYMTIHTACVAALKLRHFPQA